MRLVLEDATDKITDIMMYLGSRDGGIKVRNSQSMIIGTQKPGGGYCLSRALRKAETEVNIFR